MKKEQIKPKQNAHSFLRVVSYLVQPYSFVKIKYPC